MLSKVGWSQLKSGLALYTQLLKVVQHLLLCHLGCERSPFKDLCQLGQTVRCNNSYPFLPFLVKKNHANLCSHGRQTLAAFTKPSFQVVWLGNVLLSDACPQFNGAYAIYQPSTDDLMTSRGSPVVSLFLAEGHKISNLLQANKLMS